MPTAIIQTHARMNPQANLKFDATSSTVYRRRMQCVIEAPSGDCINTEVTGVLGQQIFIYDKSFHFHLSVRLSVCHTMVLCLNGCK